MVIPLQKSSRAVLRNLVANTLFSVSEDLRRAPFHLLVNVIGAAPIVPRVVRLLLLRLGGITVTRAHVWPHVYFGDRQVQLGDTVTINVGCLFAPHPGAAIVIGDSTHVGYQVSFLTSMHDIGPSSHRCGDSWSAAITVGNGAWIGARVTVLGGVSIGNGCIIAAGSLVRQDCAPNGLYAGVPARRVRDLPGS